MSLTLILLFTAVNQQNHLPPGLLQSICYVESKYNVKAVHHHDGKGSSLGICQIKLLTARLVGFKGTEKDLMRPENNIKYAGKYLAKQLKRYHGHISSAVVAYNQGSVRTFTSTSYSRKVFKVAYVNTNLCWGK